MSVASAGIQVVSVMCGALITSCRLPCFAHIFREVENQHKCGNLHVYHLYTTEFSSVSYEPVKNFSFCLRRTFWCSVEIQVRN